MARRPLPRDSLATNLRVLMDAAGMKSPEVARRAGVDPKTVNNMLNRRYDPRPELAEKVAAVFNLSGWQLLIPDLPAELAKDGKLQELIANYLSADEDGRDSINRVAEVAARYRKG